MGPDPTDWRVADERLRARARHPGLPFDALDAACRQATQVMSRLGGWVASWRVTDDEGGGPPAVVFRLTPPGRAWESPSLSNPGVMPTVEYAVSPRELERAADRAAYLAVVRDQLCESALRSAYRSLVGVLFPSPRRPVPEPPLPVVSKPEPPPKPSFDETARLLAKAVLDGAPVQPLIDCLMEQLGIVPGGGR